MSTGRQRRHDLVVIGGGSAGLVAADFGARSVADVLLIEKDKTGGDCTWTGCVPSKALLHAAGLHIRFAWLQTPAFAPGALTSTFPK